MHPIRLVVEYWYRGEPLSLAFKRVSRFLQAGISIVLLVDTEDRGITIYQRGGGMEVVEEGEEVGGDDFPPGYPCPVADFLPPRPQLDLTLAGHRSPIYRSNLELETRLVERLSSNAPR